MNDNNTPVNQNKLKNIHGQKEASHDDSQLSPTALKWDLYARHLRVLYEILTSEAFAVMPLSTVELW